MKAALCMYGKIGGMAGKNGLGQRVDFVACAKSIKKHIIAVNDCDVFLHNWNPEVRNDLLTLYQPKASNIEPQLQFPTTLKTDRDRRDEFICRSRWFSHGRTLDLRFAYEHQNGIHYDWIMVCRYDLMWFVEFDFSELEPGFLYASHFNDWTANKGGPNRHNHSLKAKRLLDMWFVGSSSMMDDFAGIYDRLNDYSLTDPHCAVWQHIEKTLGPPMEVTKFKFYRWFDYELYRNRQS